MASLVEPNRVPRSALVLGLGGLIPFIALAIGVWRPLAWLPQQQALTAFIVYGAVILSFLGGIRWGAAIGPHGPPRPARDFSLSVVPSLAGWAAPFLPPVIGVALLISGFLLQALWDVVASETGELPPWFGSLRAALTAVVTIASIAVLLRLLV
jgi:hypothetical protein